VSLYIVERPRCIGKVSRVDIFLPETISVSLRPWQVFCEQVQVLKSSMKSVMEAVQEDTSGKQLSVVEESVE
jgi:hypothetical protein